MKSMRSKANRRSLRTLVQFVLGGGLTGLVAVAADDLSALATAFLFAACTVAVTWCQNYAEDHGIIPTILPAPPTPSKKKP